MITCFHATASYVARLLIFIFIEVFYMVFEVDAFDYRKSVFKALNESCSNLIDVLNGLTINVIFEPELDNTDIRIIIAKPLNEDDSITKDIFEGKADVFIALVAVHKHLEGNPYKMFVSGEADKLRADTSTTVDEYLSQ